MEGRVDVIGNKEHRSKRSPSQALLLHCFLIVCHFVISNRYKEHLTNCSAFAFSFHNNLQPWFLSRFLERSAYYCRYDRLSTLTTSILLSCCRWRDCARVPLDVLILVETAVSLSAIWWKRGIERWNLKIGGSISGYFYRRYTCEK